MLTPREALEAALARTPDDVALHMAYADCLIEEGDPRGEWIRLCLEKERPGLSAAEKRVTENAIRRLRAAHGNSWLGAFDIYPVYPTHGAQYEQPELLIRWKRGWIRSFQASGYNRQVMDELAAHPFTKLMHRLYIHLTFYSIHPVPGERCIDFAFLRSLPFPVLSEFDITDTAFDDAAVEHLIAAPYFPKLRKLNMSYCHITDDGARMLAAHLHTPKLESLRLEQNLISPLGIAALAEVGVKVSEFQRFGRLEDV